MEVIIPSCKYSHRFKHCMKRILSGFAIFIFLSFVLLPLAEAADSGSAPAGPPAAGTPEPVFPWRIAVKPELGIIASAVPLLAIPVLYVLTRKQSGKHPEPYEFWGVGLAGIKGGRSRTADEPGSNAADPEKTNE